MAWQRIHPSHVHLEDIYNDYKKIKMINTRHTNIYTSDEIKIFGQTVTAPWCNSIGLLKPENACFL